MSIQYYKTAKNYFLYLNCKPFYKYYSKQYPAFYQRYSPFAKPLSLGVHKADNRAVVDMKNGFLFNRLPKVANTSIVGNLYQHMAEEMGISLREVASRHKAGHQCPSDLSWEEVDRIKNAFKFLFVRNPYTRTLSAYLSKIAKSEQKRQDYSGKAPRLFKKYSKNPSFVDFCRFLDNGGSYDNKHWAPQTSLMVLPPEGFDFIGKLENMKEDFRFVTQKIPMLNGKTLLERLGYNTRASKRLEEFYDPYCYDVISRLYKEDFETFKYETV